MIRTERLLLRRYRITDLEAFFAIFSNPEAMRYWSTLPVRDISETRGWLERMVVAGPPQSDDFVVEYRGEVIGKAGCFDCPEIGFIFHPSVWGQGIGREALGAVIPHIFGSLPTDVLTADVDPRNEACLRLLRGQGFKETGRAQCTYNLGGEWVDSVYLELRRQAG